MVEDKLKTLTWDGDHVASFFIIQTRKRVVLKKGETVEVSKDELKEIKKQPRLVRFFKELKAKGGEK